MAAAEGDILPVKHSQSGFVSAVQSRRNGTITNEIRVRCEYPSKTLMAEVSRGVVEDSEFSLVGTFDIAGVGDISGRGGDGTQTAATRNTECSVDTAHPVLLAQIGECKHSSQRTDAGISATIKIFTGRFFLRGETILVKSGNPHFSAQSQLATLVAGASAAGQVALTAISGALDQRDHHLLAHVSADLAGVCLFYCPGQLQLGCRQTLMRDPILTLLGKQLQLESFTRTITDRVQPATNDSVATAMDYAVASAVLDQQPQKPLQPAAKTETPMPPNQRTLLLLGGRCILKGDTLVLVSGLMHFCGSWRRLNSANPIRLDGTSVLARRFQPSKRGSSVVVDDALDDERDAELEQAMASGIDHPLLLTNVWLYIQGGTVFAGQTPLLTNACATVARDAQPVLLEQQERFIAQMPVEMRRGVVRLFMQRCKFTIGSGGQLRAVEGVAWMRAKKVHLGSAASEQLIIRDAVAFPLLAASHEFVRFEGRDLLYKDGLLYLEDLTPLLLGGTICLGEQEVPLNWLSGADEGLARKERPINHNAEETDLLPGSSSASHTMSTLSDGICLLESTGRMHILRGRLQIPGGHTVLVDQGVAYFPLASKPNTHPDAPAGYPPPCFIGNPVTRPVDTRQWAAVIDSRLNRATFEVVSLFLRDDGTLWLHDRVPLIKNCQLLLNGRMFSSADLLNQKSGTLREMAGGFGQMARTSGQMARTSGQMEGVSEQMGGSLGQMGGGFEQMGGGFGQMGGGFGQMGGGFGQMGGGFGQMGGGFGQMGGSLGQMGGGLGQMGGSFGQMDGGFGQMDGGFGQMGGGLGQMGGDLGQMGGASGQLMQTSGFTGSYSVFADCKREALVFSLKARFADGLHFLFGP